MPTGTGIDVHNGAGHTAADARLAEGAFWTAAGKMDGLAVAPAGNARVSVSRGAAVVDWGSGEMSRVPHGAVTLQLQPAHGSLPRVDRIMLRQNRPDRGQTDNAAVVYAETGTPGAAANWNMPHGTCLLANVTVQPGGQVTCEQGEAAIPVLAAGFTYHAWTGTGNHEVTGTWSSPRFRVYGAWKRRVCIEVGTALLSIGGDATVMTRVWVNNAQRAAWPMLVRGKSFHQATFTYETNSTDVIHIDQRSIGGRFRGLYGGWEGDNYAGTHIRIYSGGPA